MLVVLVHEGQSFGYVVGVADEHLISLLEVHEDAKPYVRGSLVVVVYVVWVGNDAVAYIVAVEYAGEIYAVDVFVVAVVVAGVVVLVLVASPVDDDADGSSDLSTGHFDP